jgi:endonuclease/exonuclease/phosphatase family metal-dependent hydrolase
VNCTLLIAGDFNSNVIWDQWDRWWNHSDVVKQLSDQGIESLYHLTSGEQQGKETKPTFFLQRKLVKPYHIDYFFGSEKFRNELSQLTIGNIEKWLEISDHLPLIAEFNVKNNSLRSI